MIRIIPDAKIQTSEHLRWRLLAECSFFVRISLLLVVINILTDGFLRVNVFGAMCQTSYYAAPTRIGVFGKTRIGKLCRHTTKLSSIFA
jgi:hypothetical protein